MWQQSGGLAYALFLSPAGIGTGVTSDVARIGLFAVTTTGESAWIGNVLITAEAGAVPVPATLALVSLGLLGLGWGRRRKA